MTSRAPALLSPSVIRRESAATKKQRAALGLRRLAAAYPDARCELDYGNPLELAVATILSAQCTDVRVNIVTPDLFRRYPDARAYAAAPATELEEAIRSTGFFRAKTRSLQGMARGLLAGHGGEVPRTLEELTALPGIGRKTANVILGNAFGIPGIAVDTHVTRLSARLALSAETDPVKIERDLMVLVPRRQWTMTSHLLIFHGRRICHARRPLCAGCVVNRWCPSRLEPPLAPTPPARAG